MLKITRITKKYGEVKNLGNYESVRVEIELETEILGNELVEDVSDELLKEAQRLTHRDLNRIIVKNKDE